MKTLTESAVLDAIKEKIAESSLREVAREKGFSSGFLSDVVQGRRNVSEKVATAFGYTREVIPPVVLFRKAN